MADDARGAIDLAPAAGDRAGLSGAGPLRRVRRQPADGYPSPPALLRDDRPGGGDQRLRPGEPAADVPLAGAPRGAAGAGLAREAGPLALRPGADRGATGVPGRPGSARLPGPSRARSCSTVGLPFGFAVAVLCGMAIPRGITAVVVALVIALVLGGGEYGLVRVGLVPIWATLFLPAAILLVTWAWSGDWLLDRPAPGRWVRLGLMLAATLGQPSPVTPATGRGASPTSGRSPGRASGPPAPISPADDRNAAGLYREAAQRLNVFTIRPGSSIEGHPPDPRSRQACRGLRADPQRGGAARVPVLRSRQVYPDRACPSCRRWARWPTPSSSTPGAAWTTATSPWPGTTS